jgi:hypothetical protein
VQQASAGAASLKYRTMGRLSGDSNPVQSIAVTFTARS